MPVAGLLQKKVLRQGCEHKWFAWEEENAGCVHEQIIYHRGGNWDSTILGPLGGDMEGLSELSYPRVEEAGSVSSDFHLSLSLPGAVGSGVTLISCTSSSGTPSGW